MINSFKIKLIDVLLGFGAGYGTYELTTNIVYGIIVGSFFYWILFSIRLKKEKNKNN